MYIHAHTYTHIFLYMMKTIAMMTVTMASAVRRSDGRTVDRSDGRSVGRTDDEDDDDDDGDDDHDDGGDDRHDDHDDEDDDICSVFDICIYIYI